MTARRLKEMRGARTAPDALQAVFPQDSPHFFRRHPVMQQDRARPDGLQRQERDQLADKIIRQDEDVAADTQKDASTAIAVTRRHSASYVSLSSSATRNTFCGCQAACQRSSAA